MCKQIIIAVLVAIAATIAGWFMFPTTVEFIIKLFVLTFTFSFTLISAIVLIIAIEEKSVDALIFGVAIPMLTLIQLWASILINRL